MRNRGRSRWFGRRLASFAKTDSAVPTLLSCTVEANGQTLTLVFSEPVKGVSGSGLSPHSGLVVNIDDILNTVLNYSSGNSTDTIIMTLSAGTIAAVSVVTLSYSRASATSDITDMAGSYLANFTGFAVTNNSVQ